MLVLATGAPDKLQQDEAEYPIAMTDKSAPDPFAMVATIKSRGPAPVHLWDPPYCGEIDMEIRRDGSWYHQGRPIRRPAMVNLFASILKREEDGRIYLVTPVEKVGIRVEDCPFVVVDMDVEGEGEGQVITFETNTGERFALDAQHRLSITPNPETQEPHPVVPVRSGLDALISRAVFYRLVDLAAEHEVTGATHLGVWSAGTFFPFADA